MSMTGRERAAFRNRPFTFSMGESTTSHAPCRVKVPGLNHRDGIATLQPTFPASPLPLFRSRVVRGGNFLFFRPFPAIFGHSRPYLAFCRETIAPGQGNGPSVGQQPGHGQSPRPGSECETFKKTPSRQIPSRSNRLRTEQRYTYHTFRLAGRNAFSPRGNVIKFFARLKNVSILFGNLFQSGLASSLTRQGTGYPSEKGTVPGEYVTVRGENSTMPEAGIYEVSKTRLQGSPALLQRAHRRRVCQTQARRPCTSTGYCAAVG